MLVISFEINFLEIEMAQLSRLKVNL
jgi:hypothetical protein